LGSVDLLFSPSTSTDLEALSPKQSFGAELIAREMVKRAKAGEVNAARHIIESVEGKPKQGFDVRISALDELAERIARGRERAKGKKNTSPGWLRSIFPLVLIAFGMISGAAQEGANGPSLLVARPELSNVLFERSVILMLPSGDQDPRLIVGLIVNKPTRKKVADVFPKERTLRDRSDTVYFGGPLDVRTPGAVFRTAKPSKNSIHLFEDVYVSFDADFIAGMLKKAKSDRNIRIFLGRSQWGVTQLQNEMLRRTWYTERAESGLIFSQSPQDVWRTLVERAQAGPVARLQAWVEPSE
jgi:putative transcriptional regulator